MKACTPAKNSAASAQDPRLILINWGSPPAPTTIEQFAELRAFSIERLDAGADSFRPESLKDAAIVALTLDALQHLPASLRDWLRVIVTRGALLYLSGGHPGRSYSLAPFAEWNCKTTRLDSQSYRIADDALVPHVLRGEEAKTDLWLAVAAAPGASARGLVFARGGGGEECPLIFAIRCGEGVVIIDITPDGSPTMLDKPIVWRLQDPVARVGNLGALFAVEMASGRDLEEPGCYNLILDDRPANYDYFSLSRLREFIAHMRSIAPMAHLDCAWTPDQTRPLSGYVEVLKRADAGFVWHGFLHHVDHSNLRNPAKELREGYELMRSITRRYRVRVQPVMIFPYERREDALLHLLASHGFEAIAEYTDIYSERRVSKDDPAVPPYLCYSTPLRPVAADLPVMRRYPVRVLTRDRMLALAALGLPVIAVAHPVHLGLNRIPLARQPAESGPGYMDCVLRFAVEKSLAPLTLAEVSNQIEKWPQPAIAAGQTQGPRFSGAAFGT
jgi:hypothetical protein